MRLFNQQEADFGPLPKDMPPVLIVGAGPVGLTLALGLINKGVPVRVYEALPELSPDARCSTIHPASLEIFQEWGVVDSILERGHRVHGLQYWERESRSVVASLEYAAIAGDTEFPFRVQCPQSILTRVLKPLVEASPLAEVHMGHALVDFTDHGESVEATFEVDGGTIDVRGVYLCGCDGAHSTTRKKLDLSFEGERYADRFLLIPTDVDLTLYYPGISSAAYFFSPDEWTITLQLPDVTRIVFRVGREEDAESLLEESHIRKRVCAFLGEDVDFKIFAKSIYNVHKRSADTFRRGRVLLVGDAAHLNNPMGGMGMNGGIQDAYVLVHKLREALGGAPDTVLDDYSAERLEAQSGHVHVQTDKNYRDMTARDETERRTRNESFRRIASSPEATRAYLLRASMLGHRA